MTAMDVSKVSKAYGWKFVPQVMQILAKLSMSGNRILFVGSCFDASFQNCSKAPLDRSLVDFHGEAS